MKKLTDDELVELNRQGYNQESSQFQSCRKTIWPELREFERFIQPNSKILDLGCGHGRLTELFTNTGVEYHGFDYSEELIRIAKSNHPLSSFRVGDARHLPYVDNYFDSIWAIALLHHLSPSATLKTLKEAYRTLCINGKIIITVWQPHSSWIKKKYHLDRRSFLKKWGGRSWLYYHYFTPNELKKLVRRSGLKILEEGFLKKNKRCNYFIVAYRAPIA